MADCTCIPDPQDEARLRSWPFGGMRCARCGGDVKTGIKRSAPDGMFQCDRCRDEFIYWMNGASETDVFFQTQRELGRTVCPECMKEARDGE